MTDHPITPPPELVRQWWEDPCSFEDSIKQAARWGADQELEACISLMLEKGWMNQSFADNLRAARRPKPPSLKEQARAELDRLIALIPSNGALAMAEPIRRALESLPD